MQIEPVKVGLVGCGNISGAYLDACRQLPAVEVVACADLEAERAAAKARDFGLRAASVDELLADPEVEVVLNLTPPSAHADVGLAALSAGKHLYGEKPLASRPAEGRRLLDEARQRGLLVGCGPDTFLGGGLQTCRKLVDEGWIGRPVASTAFMLSPGHEHWHPNPEIFYRPGGGPLLDMGPYYLTAMVEILGPVRRVTAMGRASFPERIIIAEARRGERIRVEVPTHVAGVLEHESGVISTLLTSFDLQASELPRWEIHGSGGTLAAPDPNGFGGPVRLCRHYTEGWHELPLTHGHTEDRRGLGLADLAWALRRGRPHRASGELALHVLETLEALERSAREQRHLEIESTCQPSCPLPAGREDGVLEREAAEGTA